MVYNYCHYMQKQVIASRCLVPLTSRWSRKGLRGVATLGPSPTAAWSSQCSLTGRTESTPPRGIPRCSQCGQHYQQLKHSSAYHGAPSSQERRGRTSRAGRATPGGRSTGRAARSRLSAQSADSLQRRVSRTAAGLAGSAGSCHSTACSLSRGACSCSHRVAPRSPVPGLITGEVSRLERHLQRHRLQRGRPNDEDQTGC